MIFLPQSLTHWRAFLIFLAYYNLKRFFAKKWPRKQKKNRILVIFFVLFWWFLFFVKKSDFRYRKFEKGEPSKMVFKILKSHYFRSCEVFLAFQRIQIRFTIVNLRKKLISEAKSRLKDWRIRFTFVNLKRKFISQGKVA